MSFLVDLFEIWDTRNCPIRAFLQMRVSIIVLVSVIWLLVEINFERNGCDGGKTLTSQQYSAEGFTERLASKGGNPKLNATNGYLEHNKVFWERFWNKYNFIGEELKLSPDALLTRYWRRLCPDGAVLGTDMAASHRHRRADAVLVPLSGTGDDLELIADLCQPRLVLGVEIEELPIAVFFRRILAGRRESAFYSADAGPNASLSGAGRFFDRLPDSSMPPAVSELSVNEAKTYSIAVEPPSGSRSNEIAGGTQISVAAADFLAADVPAIGWALIENRHTANVAARSLPDARDSEPMFDAAFDRRAFCAIPPMLRQAYVEQLERSLRPGARLLIVFLHPKASDRGYRPESAAAVLNGASADNSEAPAPEGQPSPSELGSPGPSQLGSAAPERATPPWAISVEEMTALFSAGWRIEVLGKSVPSRHGPEQAYLMLRR